MMNKDTALEFLRRRDKAGNSNIRIIAVKSLDEIADFIEQQVQQIQAMKNCDNCKCGHFGVFPDKYPCNCCIRRFDGNEKRLLGIGRW